MRVRPEGDPVSVAFQEVTAWNAPFRVVALRRTAGVLGAVLGALLGTLAWFEPHSAAALLAVFLGTFALVWGLAWQPIRAWKTVRERHLEVQVVVAEVRVLNWDPFKQNRWTVLSPWNGSPQRAALLLLEDRVVWMGLQGIPWPDSPHALPVQPVELIRPGQFPMTGLPHAVLFPVHDRDSKAIVPGRFRISDPSNRSEMTAIIRTHEDAFAARFHEAEPSQGAPASTNEATRLNSTVPKFHS